MNWLDSIRKVQQAHLHNRLVIFVGSGVSANSQIPTWGNLITTFAQALNYDNCQKCPEKEPRCPKTGCKKRYCFSQDEYLKIAEYYYLHDTSHNHINYYNLIKDTLRCDTKINSLDNVIFRIMPHHIITTNYDPLLECSQELNRRLYSVVAQDKELLSHNNERYIIKMHGDLGLPNSIVLKESDYIDYEQTHALISTYIKSLLIDHTFLFLGYSLNDYNLKLIMGWINYFCKKHGVTDRPHNFIVQPEPANHYEQARLEKSNIFIVDTNTIPADILCKIPIPKDLERPEGQLLYAFLECLNNQDLLHNYIPLSKILNEKYHYLQSYSKISYEDLIHVYPLGSTELKGSTLCFFNTKWYDKIEALLTNEEINNQLILETFQRAGITEIYCPINEKQKTLAAKDASPYDELFQLYLDNKYSQLATKLNERSALGEKIYYYHLLQINNEAIDNLLAAEEQQVFTEDYIKILLHKINRKLYKASLWQACENENEEVERMFTAIPAPYQDAVQYIKQLFYATSINQSEMENLLSKQEKKYAYNTNTIYLEPAFNNIHSLQAYAYDYYFFFKQNLLLLDYFPNPKHYLSYYLQAILCSYSPIRSLKEDRLWGIVEFPSYSLGEIEVDMLIKYTNPRDLLKWIKRYKIRYLKLEDSVNVINKFASYCHSFPLFGNRDWDNQLECFVILLSQLDLALNERQAATTAFLDLLSELSTKSANRLSAIMVSVKLFTMRLINDEMPAQKELLLDILLAQPLLDILLEKDEWNLYQIIEKLAPGISPTTQEQLNRQIALIKDPVIKCNSLFFFRKILPMDQYNSFLEQHINDMTGEQLFYFVLDNHVPYTEKILQRYVDLIAQEEKKRTEKPYRKLYPDPLQSYIEFCILLKLLGKPLDIALLAPYQNYSDHLSFILHPKQFDYSKVDTNNMMWGNFFRSKEYLGYLKAHKSEILTDQLAETFSLGLASEEQQKIIFGLLSDEEEMWNYGKKN